VYVIPGGSEKSEALIICGSEDRKSREKGR